MRAYEAILSILEEKGSVPLSEICDEVNAVMAPHYDKKLLPSHITSIVTKNKDLFLVNNGQISIHPDKYLYSLHAMLEGFEGISYQIRVNFIKNKFIALEWRNEGGTQPFSNLETVRPGCLEEFKREIYTVNIWDWEPVYDDKMGIILEGKYWFVKLKTKGTVYQSEGTESFPLNWNKFCRAVEKLTGTPFR